MAGVISFLENPLVTWVKTFTASKDEVGFQEVSDAVYLIDVLANILERDVEKIHRQAKDPSARLQNWARLLQTIQAYYMDSLQQVVVMKTPDIFNILEHPSKDLSLSELERVLLLLLGCAVQCDRKEHFINDIKSLDITCQKALVDCIKEVTDNADNVVAMDTYGDSDDAKQLYTVVKKVVIERNDLFQRVVTLKQERDYYESEVSRKKGELTAPPSLEKYQLLRDLQDYKKQAHQATIELEEKGKTISEAKEELQGKQEQLNKVKAENQRLEKDAKFARDYRDELDNLKEKSLKADKLEKEMAKYKEKIHEMDYFKARVEELKEDNGVLCECKDKLEDQVTSVQGQLNTAMTDLSQVQLSLQQVQQEKGDVEKRLNEVMEENALLDFEKNRMKDGYTGPLRRMISYTSSEFLHGSQLQLAAGHPISDELNDSMTSHVTRLEVENDQLKHELEQIKSKLSSTQQEVETLLNQSEKDYKKRLKGSDSAEKKKQYQAIREDVHNDLCKRFESQTKEMQTALNEKSEVVKKYQTRVGDLEKDKLHLAEQVKGLEEQIRSARYQRDELNNKVEKLNQDLKINQGKMRLAQNSQHSLEQLQLQKEDLSHEVTCQKEQIQQDKVLVKRVQRENEDLLQKLQKQQDKWGKDRDQCGRLQVEIQRLETERDELRNNIESVRECSDQHIKQLEEQLFVLQDKSVAMENLNDYLNNLSVIDNSVDTDQPDVFDTDLDAHLSLNPSTNNSFVSNKDSSFSSSVSHKMDKNHNEKGSRLRNSHHKREKCSLDTSDSDSNMGFNNSSQSLPSSKDSNNKALLRPHSMSMDYGDSDYPGMEEPARIKYVKRSASFNHAANGGSNSAGQEPDKSSSQRFLNKLKSYVKSPKLDAKNNELSSKSNGSSSSRAPLHEVQLRQENTAFVRSSKNRSTIHGHPLMESSPLVINEEFHSPVVEAKSRPVSTQFCRKHALRQTMPERRTKLVFPEKKSSSSRNNSQHSMAHSRESVRSHSHKASRTNEHNNSYSCDSRRNYSSDMDSGVGVFSESSPALNDSPQQNDTQENIDLHHLVTSIQIMSSETVESYRKISNGKSGDKLKLISDKLIQLQNRNQALSSDNKKLRRMLESVTRPGAITYPDKRTNELEAENRKLRLIVETLQNTLSGRNPYDDKEYHYFTNV